MKKFYQRFGLKIILVFTILSSGIVMGQSNDVCVRITETTLNEALQTMIDARAINLGDYTHTWLAKGWFINLDGGSIDILPDRKARISGGIVATAAEALVFTNNITSHVNIVIDGELELRSDQNGYKLIFKLTDANAYNTDNTWYHFSSLLTVAADIGMKVFIYKMPEIELTSGTKLLPDFLTSYFSSSIPEVSTTDTEVILGYSVAGARKITIQNEVWDNTSSPNHSSGMIQVLEGSTWKSYNSPYTAWWDLNSNHSVRTASLINYNNANYRFSNWNNNINTATNDISIQVKGDESFNASFFVAQPITIRTSLEGTLTSGQNMTFQNQTVSSPYSDYAFMPPKSTSFGALQTLGSSVWNFYGWGEDGSASLNRTASLTSGATYTAEYKGSLKSNSSTAFTNTSQRKFVRTDNGYLHLVYESMNHIWYERSTNNGSSWQIMNGGKYLDQGAVQSKLPSIATIYDDIAIVWQEENNDWGSPNGPGYSIKFARFDENSICRLTSVIYDGYKEEIGPESGPKYSTNADPVVAFNIYKKVLVCWKCEIPASPNFSGIYYKFGGIYISPDLNGIFPQKYTKS